MRSRASLNCSLVGSSIVVERVVSSESGLVAEVAAAAVAVVVVTARGEAEQQRGHGGEAEDTAGEGGTGDVHRVCSVGCRLADSRYLTTSGGPGASGKTPGRQAVVGGPGSVVLGDEEVPAVEAVLAAVDDQVARLPRAVLGRRVGDQVRPSAAVDARDDLIDLHRRRTLVPRAGSAGVARRRSRSAPPGRWRWCSEKRSTPAPKSPARITSRPRRSSLASASITPRPEAVVDRPAVADHARPRRTRRCPRPARRRHRGRCRRATSRSTKPDALGLGGAELAAREDEVERPAEADDARQAVGAAVDERARPTAARGSRTGPPSPATRRSHHAASSIPPATHQPSTAAITGLDSASRVGPERPAVAQRAAGRAGWRRRRTRRSSPVSTATLAVVVVVEGHELVVEPLRRSPC